MSDIPARLSALRASMREEGVQAYIIPTNDYHNSEFLCAYFQARAYFSGFDGSAGTLVVLEDGAFLWTDGRYFLQAAQQLDGSGITLMRMGERGVPTIEDFLKSRLSEGATVALDGSVNMARTVKNMTAALETGGITLRTELDLVTPNWPQRPPLPEAKAWLLDEKYAGESAQDKLAKLRAAMDAQGAELWVIGDCEDAAWLLNLRGGDFPYTPVPLCFCFVEREGVCLCMDAQKRSPELTAELEALGVSFRPYEGALGYACRCAEGATVMLNAAKLNYALWSTLNERAIIIEAPDTITRGRMLKNAVQLEHLRRAQLKEGLAVTRFMRWIKENAGQPGVTELSAKAKLDALIKSGEGCLGNSFSTICAYGAHAAIVHYEPDAASDCPIEARGLLLVDSGGQYYEGTTDETRTYALGTLTEEERRHFTLVLKGMLSLMAAKFPAGTNGEQLDVFARAPLWREGLDFRHGTGHGIGYLLGVHEDPVRIRSRQARLPFEPGMTVSDEPGLYIENSHGIRLENMLLCRAAERESEYGAFYGFECMTLIPIDLDALDASLLSPFELETLNAYHKRVREALSPLLDGDERAWLEHAAREL